MSQTQINNSFVKSLEVDSNFWWESIHSGSEAIETARRFLEDSRTFGGSNLGAFDMALVCSELIFRVTGEKVTPKKGFFWASHDVIEGPLFSSIIFNDE